MARIISFFAVLFFAISLNAASYDKFFADFDKNFDKSAKIEKQKLHNELKNIYLKISTNTDKSGRKEALKRLIKSSKSLGYNAKSYENELKRLGGNVKNSAKISTQNQTKISQNSATKDKNLEKIAAAKPKQISKISNKKTAKAENKAQKTETKNSTTTTQKTETKKTEKTQSKTPQKSSENLDTDAIVALAPSIKTNDLKHTKGKIIVIDAGHGGKDPGAVGNGLQEKKVVFEIAKKTEQILKKRGYKVFLTRTNDTFWNLQKRTKFANAKNADMFISIHANAAPNKDAAQKMNGIETFFLSPARSERSKRIAQLENSRDLDDMSAFSQETFLNFLNREKIIASNKLAIDIQSYMLHAVAKTFKTKDGGVREAPFWVLVGAQMPAVLVEIGYITHPNEGKNLGKTAYKNAIAQGISDGVSAYFMKNR